MDSSSITRNRFVPFSQLDKNKFLFEAAKCGNEAVANELLEADACLKARNEEGSTPLIVAAHHGRIALVYLFIQKGTEVNAVNNIGTTALMYAALKGATGIVALLIQARANVNLIDNEGDTALLCAVQNDRTAIVDLLIKANVNLDVSIETWKKALTFAIQYKHSETAFYLLNAMSEKQIKIIKAFAPELNEIIKQFEQTIIANQQKIFALYSYLIYIRVEEDFQKASPLIKEATLQLAPRLPDWYNQRLEADLTLILKMIHQKRTERKETETIEPMISKFACLAILPPPSFEYTPSYSNGNSPVIDGLGKENINPKHDHKREGIAFL